MYNVKKNTAALAVLIFLCMVLSRLIIGNSYKIIILAFSLPLLFLWAISRSQKDLIAIVIVASFLPIKLKITTTNLGSISQYICFFCFGVYLFNAFLSNRKITFNKNLILLLIPLVFFGAFSTLGTLGNASMFRTSFWSLILLFAAVLFLILLDQIAFKDDAEKHLYIVKWLDLILLCTCLQILIGIMVYYFPKTGDWFTFFFASSGKAVGLMSRFEAGDLLRMRTISLPSEAVGEFCAMLTPYACYRLASMRKLSYVIAGLILLLGIALSGTRSGMILSILSIFTYYVFVEKSVQIKTLHLSIIGIATVALISYGIAFSTIVTRSLITYNAYLSGSDMGTVLNRKFMFAGNWDFFINRLSYFGNGLVSPVSAGYLKIDFHSIYLTIIYQFGVIGSIFYFSLPFFLLIRLLKTLKKTGEQLKHTKVFIISFLIFLINEMKFEFTRKLEYVIIIWVLLSIYYLHTKQFSAKENPSLSLKE